MAERARRGEAPPKTQATRERQPTQVERCQALLEAARAASLGPHVEAPLELSLKQAREQRDAAKPAQKRAREAEDRVTKKARAALAARTEISELKLQF